MILRLPSHCPDITHARARTHTHTHPLERDRVGKLSVYSSSREVTNPIVGFHPHDLVQPHLPPEDWISKYHYTGG